ncbi:Copper chaperone CopZ [Acetitomaculum ruminis DSM 5522]|uniref:Copper chaperone CopZ n=1 Tax=Acetitomaculum ruminis DSM 5522 TaxID=1120918 RepID=A0A1I0V3A8_9FIRM|nr:heavy metal-associated domain-containing protein [Acetitomaculum ruminis]SFA70016.1 Copper chaperone CopZ [Acetitomaculum ruminis DSM 5522]
MFKTTVNVEGMQCGMCEAHVNDAIRKAFPQAKKVKSSCKNKIATFLTPYEVKTIDVKRCIASSGYDFISSSTEALKEEKKSFFSFFLGRKLE